MLLLVITHYVSDVYIITSLLLIVTHYYNCHFCLLLHVITKPIITLLLHIFTLLLPVITLLIITYYYMIYYYLLLHQYYIIITSLLPHYVILKIHVKMDSLLPIITMTCSIITSLLPITSLFPIITYY